MRPSFSGRIVRQAPDPDKLKKFRAGSDALKFGSHSVFVVDEFSSDVLFEKDAAALAMLASSVSVSVIANAGRLATFRSR